MRRTRKNLGKRTTSMLTAAAALLVIGGAAFGADRNDHGRDGRGFDQDRPGAKPVQVSQRTRDDDRRSDRGDDRRSDDRHDDRDDNKSFALRIGDGNFSFGISIGDRDRHDDHHRVIVRPEPRRWVPAHYEEHSEQVLVEPARCEKRWVPPVYETRCDRWGRHVEVLVREGYWQTIEIPARYETRCVKVLVPGHWEEIDYRDVHDVHFGHDNGVGHAYGRDH